MARRYRRRYYYNDDGLGCFAVIILWLIGTIVVFVKENLELIMTILLITLVLSLAVIIIVKRKEICKYFHDLYNHRIMNKLKKKSPLYSKILEINSKYHFTSLEPYYARYQVFRKSNLETCNIDDYLLMTINSQYSNLKNYKFKYDKLNIEYECYENEYKQLRQYIDDDEAIKLKIKIKKYDELQNEIYNNMKLKCDIEFKVVVYINYTSKMGRVRRQIHRCYDKFDFFEKLNEYFELKKQNKLNEISSRVERSKMSESLRYNILKRDNYRCQICGASAKDGAQLQVDHIIPVSKGGKTVESNLQTLCSRCNIGKSNKM